MELVNFCFTCRNSPFNRGWDVFEIDHFRNPLRDLQKSWHADMSSLSCHQSGSCPFGHQSGLS